MSGIAPYQAAVNQRSIPARFESIRVSRRAGQLAHNIAACRIGPQIQSRPQLERTMKGTILDFLILAAEKPELAKELAALATKYGFTELGRFANRYKRLFGELPSQTLSRDL